MNLWTGRRNGAKRILVNGSFVTRVVSPNDVDVILLPSVDTASIMEGEGSSELRWPFIQILFAADDADFEAWARQDFGTDREGRSKGVVELVV